MGAKTIIASGGLGRLFSELKAAPRGSHLEFEAHFGAEPVRGRELAEAFWESGCSKLSIRGEKRDVRRVYSSFYSCLNIYHAELFPHVHVRFAGGAAVLEKRRGARRSSRRKEAKKPVNRHEHREYHTTKMSRLIEEADVRTCRCMHYGLGMTPAEIARFLLWKVCDVKACLDGVEENAADDFIA